MTAPLHLIACVAGKLDRPAPAADLYRSDWFAKARAYVEGIGAPWFILSAKHGLVAPETVIAPYDETLIGVPRWRRFQWGDQVLTQLWDAAPSGAPIVLLAGRLYREGLLGDAKAPQPACHRWQWSAPMEGLGIGEQKAWLAARTPVQRGQLALAIF